MRADPSNPGASNSAVKTCLRARRGGVSVKAILAIVGAVVGVGVLVWAIARLVGVERFTAFYGNVLIFIGYLFTPWTAINLVDYFYVRKGLYSIREIFKPDGMYGRWGWRGQAAYGVALSAMAPFMVTAPFTGPVARALGGVDLTIFVGLLVAGTVYLRFCRDLDLDAEWRVVKAEGLVRGQRHP